MVYAYTYDSMGRLLTVHLDDVLVEEYQYKVDTGSRSSEMNSRRGISYRDQSYSAEDQLLTSGTVNYSYDQDGYLLSRDDTASGAHVSYSYSSLGQLQQVVLADNTTVSYSYDPKGRRLSRAVDGITSHYYLWQGSNRLLAVYDGAGQLTIRFSYASGRLPYKMVMAGAVYYLAYDQVGSLRAVTDAQGTLVKGITYDIFGNILTDSNPAMQLPFGFAGGLTDPLSGLLRFGARDYDPDTGRWTAKDPLFFASDDVDLYGYCLNNPIDRVDPDGLYSGHNWDTMNRTGHSDWFTSNPGYHSLSKWDIQRLLDKLRRGRGRMDRMTGSRGNGNSQRATSPHYNLPTSSSSSPQSSNTGSPCTPINPQPDTADPDVPWHDGTTSGGDGGSASTGIPTNGDYSGAGNGSIMAINNVQVNSNGSSSVIISWSTPTNTKSWLDYGLSTNYSDRVYSANQFSRNHTVILHNISADKLYHFQITVENNCNFNLIASLQITCQSSSLSTPDQTFGTAPDGVAGGSTEENVFFYHTDPMGTPVAMSDHTGTKVWEADYFPFGREYTVEATIANNRRFINKEKDAESGYSYFGARYLDTSLGRFLTPDPVKLVDQNGKINQAILTNPQRLNMYVYGLNNPYRYVDPDGRAVIKFGPQESSNDSTYNQKVTVTSNQGKPLGAFSGSSTPNPYKPSNRKITGTDAYPQVASGTYPATNGFHKGQPAIVINDNKAVPTTTINPNFPQQEATATYIHVHSGQNSQWKGSAGCPTIKPSDWNRFIDNMPDEPHKVVIP